MNEIYRVFRYAIGVGLILQEFLNTSTSAIIRSFSKTKSNK